MPLIVNTSFVGLQATMSFQNGVALSDAFLALCCIRSKNVDATIVFICAALRASTDRHDFAGTLDLFVVGKCEQFDFHR